MKQDLELKLIKAMAKSTHEELPSFTMAISSKHLNSNSKLILSEIYTLFIENNHKHLFNEYIGECVGLSKQTVSRCLSKLAHNNWIERKMKRPDSENFRRQICGINLFKMFGVKTKASLFMTELQVHHLFKLSHNKRLLKLKVPLIKNDDTPIKNKLYGQSDSNVPYIKRHKLISHHNIRHHMSDHQSRTDKMNDRQTDRRNSKIEKKGSGLSVNQAVSDAKQLGYSSGQLRNAESLLMRHASNVDRPGNYLLACLKENIPQKEKDADMLTSALLNTATGKQFHLDNFNKNYKLMVRPYVSKLLTQQFSMKWLKALIAHDIKYISSGMNPGHLLYIDAHLDDNRPRVIGIGRRLDVLIAQSNRFLNDDNKCLKLFAK